MLTFVVLLAVLVFFLTRVYPPRDDAYNRARILDVTSAPSPPFQHKYIIVQGRAVDPELVLPRYFKYKERHLVGLRNQGQCASCWAFAIADMLADRVSLQTGSHVRQNLSVQELLSCFQPSVFTCQTGGVPEVAYHYAVAHGLSTEDSYPYQQMKGGAMAACEADSPWYRYVWVDQDRHLKRPDKVYVRRGSIRRLCAPPVDQEAIRANIRNMKTEIYTHGPIVGTLMVYEDLYKYDGESIYKVTPGARLRGGHAIEIFGWADEGVNTAERGFQGAYWICRNSWGTKWPRRLPHNPGFFYVSMGNNEAGIESRASSCQPLLNEEMLSHRIPDIRDLAYSSYTDYVADPEREQFFSHLQARRKPSPPASQ